MQKQAIDDALRFHLAPYDRRLRPTDRPTDRRPVLTRQPSMELSTRRQPASQHYRSFVSGWTALLLHRPWSEHASAPIVSDSITSISCGCVVQRVVRLAARLADCCMQLAADFCCGLAVRQVVQLVVRLTVCSTTCCGLMLWTCCWLSICCGFVVQHVVQRIHNKSK